MKEKHINGQIYKLPGSLTSFQEEMYVHLINWKWKYITKKSGCDKYKGNPIEYDAILPECVQSKYPLIYPKIIQDIINHRNKFYFKFHKHFNHVASSQVANVNLFLPLLLHSQANNIFSLLKPDFKSLATLELYKGFRVEYWDGNSNEDQGLLKDHNSRSGTDSDIAIAYYNQKNELCLWLIEHKLTEKEFTECGGFKSKDRDKSKHKCEKNFFEILSNRNYCFYHSLKGREYWNLTYDNKAYFVNHSKYNSCPFKGGMNQLWRNQLMGFALEKEGRFKEVYFSVVKHPKNEALDKSINQYKDLINNNNRFSVINSREVIDEVAKLNDSDLNVWLSWYKELYKINS